MTAALLLCPEQGEPSASPERERAFAVVSLALSQLRGGARVVIRRVGFAFASRIPWPANQADRPARLGLLRLELDGTENEAVVVIQPYGESPEERYEYHWPRPTKR